MAFFFFASLRTMKAWEVFFVSTVIRVDKGSVGFYNGNIAETRLLHACISLVLHYDGSGEESERWRKSNGK